MIPLGKRKEGTARRLFLVDKTFNGLFIIMLVGMLSGMLCPIVDAVITGQFLGSDAVAATGLLAPVMSLTGVITVLFSTGTNQMCIRAVGKADLRRVNQIFSTMLLCSAALCAAAGILMFVLAAPISQGLGATAGLPVVQFAADYLRGYAFGLLPMGISILVNTLLALDNDRNRVSVYTLVLLAADIALDLVNVLVVHGGMFGMALASSLSYLIAFGVTLLHFRKKDRILHFTPDNLNFGDVREVLMIGLAGVIPQGMHALRGLVCNYVLLRAGGAGALAAMSVASSALILYSAVTSSLQSITGSVTSLAYGEEDRTSLVRTLRVSLQIGYRVGLVFLILIVALAGPISTLFLNGGSEETHLQAMRFLRCTMLGNLFMLGCYSINGSLLGTRQLKLNYLVSILRDGLWPILCIALGGLLSGLRGIEAGLVLMGLLSLLSCCLIVWCANRKRPTSLADFLVLPDDFYLRPEDMFEASMQNLREVTEVSEQARLFCLKRGESAKTAQFAALFVEEMAGNTLRHGIKPGRSGVVELRMIFKPDKRMIRLRDNGKPFDPVKWLEQNHPEDPSSALGIRMIVGMADSVQYIHSMSLNNLMVFL